MTTIIIAPFFSTLWHFCYSNNQSSKHHHMQMVIFFVTNNMFSPPMVSSTMGKLPSASPQKKQHMKFTGCKKTCFFVSYQVTEWPWKVFMQVPLQVPSAERWQHPNKPTLTDTCLREIWNLTRSLKITISWKSDYWICIYSVCIVRMGSVTSDLFKLNVLSAPGKK